MYIYYTKSVDALNFVIRTWDQ